MRPGKVFGRTLVHGEKGPTGRDPGVNSGHSGMGGRRQIMSG